ncbi:MAG: imidazolonepropionase [Bacteroidetes bacterium]|nr:imidazolonepropionase [Bacteroidota bacterium]MCB0845653.1 imidazolonepropionase [Bacteroidota bacterium]
MRKLIGPFSQIVTMNGLPLKGTLHDPSLEVIEKGGIWIENELIVKIGPFEELIKNRQSDDEIEELGGDYVALPGMIDAHTHICFAGSRARDYVLRVGGTPYLEIARQGGGIWDSVTKTRQADFNQLLSQTGTRALRLLNDGVTTAEVKSGYGLTVEDELKMLKVIREVHQNQKIDLIGTCLAAHICPKDFEGTQKEYLTHILHELLPKVKEEGLSNRIDIFVEESAFSVEEGDFFLRKAKEMGFSVLVHADQFHPGGSQLAVKHGAVSADHLEASTDKEIALLANSDTIAMALPGASIGLGVEFTPCRKLLDAGAALAIASDWNPGSAPMGDLLTQAAILGAYEKLSFAETIAGVTFRAAAALALSDRGTLETGKLADLIAFPTNDYREILYHQGKMRPAKIWKKGEFIS